MYSVCFKISIELYFDNILQIWSSSYTFLKKKKIIMIHSQ